MTETKSMQPLTLFVAEDDEDDRMLLEDAAAKVRHPLKLHFVNDGRALMEALAEHRSGDPLLVLDLNMPRMGGHEVLRHLRADPARVRTPVVVLSTSNSSEDIELAYELGANTYFEKPSSFEDLVGLLESMVEYWGRSVLAADRDPLRSGLR